MINLYTYTSERLKEFERKKTDNDIILSPIVLIDKKNSIDLENNTKTFYFDITTYYKSYAQENPVVIEKAIYEISNHDNYKIIINYNTSHRFMEDFGQFISKVISINNIYNDKREVNCDFSSLSQEQIKLIKQKLAEKLYGHEQFKEEFIKQIKNFSILHDLGELKIFSLLICGESGIGKTELARIIHNTLFSDAKPIKINLGNYNTQGSLNTLIGSPKGYYGSERGGELSNKIKNSDSKIILIDEFEKANSDIFNFFYELLEDGKFTDLTENEYNLDGYLIIFTTNLNKNNYKQIIPSPLLSRFTMKSIFEPLTFELKNKYIKDRAKSLINIYNEKHTSNLDYKLVINKIDVTKVKSISNLRYLNRLVQISLIETIEENIELHKEND